MPKIALKQELSLPPQAVLDALAQIIVLVQDSADGKHTGEFAYAERLAGRRARRPAGADEPLITELPNALGTRVALDAVRPDASSFERLSRARRLAAAALAEQPERVDVILDGVDAASAPAAAAAVLSALLAAAHRPPQYKREPAPARPLKAIRVWGLNQPLDFARIRAEAAANNLARELTLRPANRLTPTLYRKELVRLAETHGWQMSFHDEKALAKLGAGAFLAVSQGSAERDAGIVHLQYSPQHGSGGPRGRIALVGKGICFDTGGVNLKPARGMLGMHGDMQGSAVALGTLLALSRLKVPFAIDCWLALAHNAIGPRAYRPNDVVTACDGTSIEVVHTDAEGRMVLADTLALAARAKPDLILDYATLTGACVYALGTRYSGAFTNRSDWFGPIIEAGRASGERVWPFPHDADYDEALESTVADVKQCTLEGEADHILAARFLSRFVPAQVPWIHLDLAAGEHKGGLAHVPTDVTGFGVRFTLGLLLDRKLLDSNG